MAEGIGMGGAGGGVRPFFRGLSIASSGMSAQRRRLDVIAQNIANAETVGYQREMVRTAPAAVQVVGSGELKAGELPVLDGGSGEGVRVTGVEVDASEGPLVYDPSHPDADADGYVRYPNVSMTDELVDLMESRRVYEANVSVFQAMKMILRRTIDL